MAEVALRDYVTDIDGMIENSAYDAAIHHCRHILMQYPKYLEAYRVLGKALLEKDDHPAAGDVFQRVLGVDPEDFVARVGLSIVRDRQGELDQAIWHMERAYDLMPSNEIIQSELRRLYTRRDGVEPERVSLTRSALARMYAHGDLYVEAIANLRQLLHEQPDRLDLQVLLAEVLWRNEQRIEASDLALAITAKSPYCLKANLILGDILQASGNGEGETPLRRAQAIDPDNIQAARLFGSDSVLPVRRTVITRLEQMSYSQLLETGGPATDTEEVPDWLRGLAELNTPAMQLEPPESAINPPLPTGLHMPGTQPLRGEIPDWLQGLAAPREETTEPSQELPGWLAAMGTASITSTPAKPAAAPSDDDWMAQLQVTPTPEPAAAMRDEDVPDWILKLGTGELDPRKLRAAEPAADEPSDWMSQLGVTGLLDQTAPAVSAEPASEEVPDWLRQLGTGSLEPTHLAVPAEPGTPDETPDWLRQLGNTGPLDQSVVSAGGDTPDWLAQIQSTVKPATAAEAESANTSDWLAQLQATVPPLDQAADDETPDWLAQLGGTGPLDSSEPQIESPTPPAARKIAADTDRATIERLVEAFSPAVPEEPIEPPQAEAGFSLGEAAGEVGKAGAGLVLGGAALVGAAASGLGGLMKDREDQPVAETTSLPEGDISPDDALAFFARLSAGKEDQLRAEAEADGESRMAAIMGRKVEPTKPIEPEPIVASVAEVATPEPSMPEAVAPEATALEAAAILEGDISPDDALAFFARLSAGKEDQLRAEAEAEGESRMAAIMGRKVEAAKPIEPEPIVASVAEVATPEPSVPEAVAPEATALEAAAILEGDISPDDALAFFARLSAGKEDQLRAEAEAEGESRMAAIMGRKVEPAKPIEPEPMLEASLEEVPVVMEEVPDWVSQLGSTVAVDVVAGDTVAVDTVAPIASDELPDWLLALRPSDEALAAEPVPDIEPVLVDELPAWLQAMQPSAPETPAAGDASTDAPIHEAVTIEPTLMEVTVSDTFDVEPTSTHDLPEWLRDMQPSASAAEPTPSDSLPDWLRAIQPESIEVVDERAVAEVEPEPVSDAVIETVGVSEVEAIAEPTPAPIAEAVSAAPAAKAPIGPVSWWTQSAQDEGEEPISELPAAVKPTTSTVRLAPATLSTPASRMTRERTLEPSGRETRRRYTRSTEKRRAEVEPVPALNSVNIDPLVTQLESDKYNHAVRLELARAWWSMGNRDSALDEYAKLINPARVENLSDEELDERDFAEAGPLADDIIADLERIVEIDEHAAWPRLLGDICMKTGDLSRALEMYRRALRQL